MSKPTLFFSHSSKDKDMVLAIKNKVMQYTSGTLEIFQSSDGESIPFGTNWIHKVEEGLKEAKVMFVSAWNDPSTMEDVCRQGAEKASWLANKTLRKVYKKVGFVPRG